MNHLSTLGVNPVRMKQDARRLSGQLVPLAAQEQLTLS